MSPSDDIAADSGEPSPRQSQAEADQCPHGEGNNFSESDTELTGSAVSSHAPHNSPPAAQMFPDDLMERRTVAGE